MADRRKIEAYDRRLAKMTEDGDLRVLESRDLGATVTAQDGDLPEVTGTLLAFTHKTAAGFFGPMVRTSITLCTSCPRCNTKPVEMAYPVLLSIKRTVTP